MDAKLLKQDLERSYSARYYYKKATRLGRANIEYAFTTDRLQGLLPETCGKEGFRVVNVATGEIIKCSSAHKTLTTLCWDPDIVPATPKRPRSDGDRTIRYDQDRTYYGRSGGAEHGKDVHVEVQHFIQWSPKKFSIAHEPADPLSKNICCSMSDLGVWVVDAERIVRCVNWGCATAMDAWGIDKVTGEAVGFEYKTGSDGTFTQPCRKNPKMRAPYFDDIDNTPLNRARMQLMYGCILFERGFGVTMERAYVIHAPSASRKAIVVGLGPVAKKRALLVKAIDEWKERAAMQKKEKQQNQGPGANPHLFSGGALEEGGGGGGWRGKKRPKTPREDGSIGTLW